LDLLRSNKLLLQRTGLLMGRWSLQQQHLLLLLLLLLPRRVLWVDADSDGAALLRHLNRSNGDWLRLWL
jgi:hypothetical protein